jgi:hypothetical protein
VAVWYLMNGRWTPVEEIDHRLAGKVTKMIGSVGERGLKALGKDRKAYRQEIHERLKAGRVYVLDPSKKYPPKPKAQPEAKAPEAGRVGVPDTDEKHTPKSQARPETKASAAGLAQEYGLR